MEAYSNDCGKWPSIRPCSASSASASGPRRPGSRVAVIETGSTSSSRFIRTRSRERTPAYPSRRAARPPVTQVPPPNGTTARWCSTAKASTAATSSWSPGRTTTSGASSSSPARARSRSGVDLPRVRSRRVSSSVRTCSAPSRSRRPSSSAVVDLARREARVLDRGPLVEAEGELDQAAGGVGQRCGGGRVAPAGRVHLVAVDWHALQCDTCRHFVTLRISTSGKGAYLDAARACILDVGWRRTTLTEVARRAGVSRMTIYRTWSDMPQLLGDLMTREWGNVVAAIVDGPDAGRDAGRPAGHRPRRRGPRAARQRAVRPDRRARPRAAAALPALPPRPVPGRGPGAGRGVGPGRPEDR